MWIPVYLPCLHVLFILGKNCRCEIKKKGNEVVMHETFPTGLYVKAKVGRNAVC